MFDVWNAVDEPFLNRIVLMNNKVKDKQDRNQDECFCPASGFPRTYLKMLVSQRHRVLVAPLPYDMLCVVQLFRSPLKCPLILML